MLEKNKDYVEMRVSSTDCALAQNESTQICIDGYVYTPYMRLPDPGELYILISKEKFEKMQADVNINSEIAKQWEINYALLLKKIGIDTVEELVNYLNFEAECDTLREAIANLGYSVKFARDERRDLSKKLDECEKDYISERDKADVEKMIWVTKHIFGCRSQQDVLQSDLEYYRAMSSAQANSIYRWKKVTGFSSCEEIEDYLVNEAECDTLHDAMYLMYKEMDRRQKKINELRNEVKCISDKWASANRSNNSWKAAAECNLPKELIEKLNLLRDDISGRSTVIERYKRDIEKWQKATGCLRPEDISTASLVTKAMQLDQEVKILNGALQKWREGTGCPGPIAAKALIESGMAYEHGFHEAQEENRKLTEEVDSWKNVTGYSTPEDYMHAKINCATPF